MSQQNYELVKAVARAICRVQLNGGDPDQPAMRWNGTEVEPQEFPAWQDYRDEANAAIAAYAAPNLLIACQAFSACAGDAFGEWTDDEREGLRYIRAALATARQQEG